MIVLKLLIGEGAADGKGALVVERKPDPAQGTEYQVYVEGGTLPSGYESRDFYALEAALDYVSEYIRLYGAELVEEIL